MNFKNRLYEKIKTAMPDMTVREFSNYCGKSEGYYGSITAQNLELSTNALLHLAEVLSLIQAQQPNPALGTALTMIAEEVADTALGLLLFFNDRLFLVNASLGL